MRLSYVQKPVPQAFRSVCAKPRDVSAVKRAAGVGAVPPEVAKQLVGSRRAGAGGRAVGLMEDAL